MMEKYPTKNYAFSILAIVANNVKANMISQRSNDKM
jgi:hypothetical protein